LGLRRGLDLHPPVGGSGLSQETGDDLLYLVYRPARGGVDACDPVGPIHPDPTEASDESQTTVWRYSTGLKTGPLSRARTGSYPLQVDF
jgi:hypothetical protein